MAAQGPGSTRSLLPSLIAAAAMLFALWIAQAITVLGAVVVWGVDDDYICFMDPQVGQWTFPDWNLFEFSWELCLFKAY